VKLRTTLNRIEVISKRGREYVYWNEDCKIIPQVQDEGRTLKLFIEEDDAGPEKER
jgi:hypothetical protein